VIKTLSLALTMLLVLCTGCAGLPAPKNANGTVSPTVALAEADLTFQNADSFAVTYITTCHLAPTTPGCSQNLVLNIKAASAKALLALQSAHTAIKNLQPGASGIDAAIADLNAALAFLQSFTAQIPQSMLTGARS